MGDASGVETCRGINHGFLTQLEDLKPRRSDRSIGPRSVPNERCEDVGCEKVDELAKRLQGRRLARRALDVAAVALKLIDAISCGIDGGRTSKEVSAKSRIDVRLPWVSKYGYSAPRRVPPIHCFVLLLRLSM